MLAHYRAFVKSFFYLFREYAEIYAHVLWCLWIFCLLTLKQRKIDVYSVQIYLFAVCPLK